MGSIVIERLRICVSVASLPHDVLGIGPMLWGALAKEGHEARLVEDGDPAVYGCDVLMLIGSPRHFVKYPRLLAGGRREQRPVTALWLLEPLPPPLLTEQAEGPGMRLANSDLHRLSPLGRRLLHLLPFQSRVRRRARSIHAARFKQELSGLGVKDCEPVTPRELAGVMCEYRWFREYYSRQWCDFVFASTPPRCEFLRRRGVAAAFVPMGYDPAWGRDLGLERDIDVLFLGNTDKTARSGPLRIVQEDLASRGIALRTVTKNCFAEERTRLLNRARIFLDVPRLPWDMPLIRLLMGMGCGALVASSWTGDPAPFAREHLVQADTGRLAEAIVHYLECEGQRRSIVTSAFEFVTRELTLERSVSMMLNAIHGPATAAPDSKGLPPRAQSASDGVSGIHPGWPSDKKDDDLLKG
jgi:hypothetical protein